MLKEDSDTYQFDMLLRAKTPGFKPFEGVFAAFRAIFIMKTDRKI
jgi:hypothetical protein